MKHTRENSMSISEAIEDIQKRTGNRRDTCAREFAKALMDSYPDLMFWQNTPPDLKDLPKEKVDLVPEVVRQVWPCPIKTSGHIMGPWLLDVYAGSRKTTQFGNKWDEPYPFNYRAKFEGERVPPEVDELPQPLMRNFRANKDAMRELRNQTRVVLKPGKKKTENVSTKYVLEAARQVAERVKRNRTSIFNLNADINQQLKRIDGGLCDDYISEPIVEISFHDGNTEKIKIKYRHDGNEKYVVQSKSTFSRKISTAIKS